MSVAISSGYPTLHQHVKIQGKNKRRRRNTSLQRIHQLFFVPYNNSQYNVASNTLNLLHRNWPQTMELTKEWNEGVRVMIESIPELQRMTSYVDVYEASVDKPHRPDDHIHLLDSWYGEIGLWFSSLVKGEHL